MRTFDQLTEDEQKRAEERALVDLLECVVDGTLRFNDEQNHDDLQDRIDKAMREAEAMRTPWFASEYVMDAAGEELRGMARIDAEDANYPDAGERVIRIS